MKILSLKGLCVVSLLYPSAALAGNGHVDRVVDVQVHSISSDGLKQINVNNSVLKSDEIKFLDIARRHLISEFGLQAETWPIMIDLINSRALYSEPVSNELIEILFKDL